MLPPTFPTTHLRDSSDDRKSLCQLDKLGKYALRTILVKNRVFRIFDLSPIPLTAHGFYPTQKLPWHPSFHLAPVPTSYGSPVTDHRPNNMAENPRIRPFFELQSSLKPRVSLRWCPNFDSQVRFSLPFRLMYGMTVFAEFGFW